MSIKRRILYSSVLLVVLFIIMGTVNWIGNSSVIDKSDISHGLEQGSMHLQGIFRGINEFIIDEGEPLSVELTQSHLRGYAEMFDSLMIKTIKDSELHSVLKSDLAPQWQIVRDGAESFLADNPYIDVEDDKAMLQYGRLTTEAKILLTLMEGLEDKTRKDYIATASRIKKITNGAAAIILVLICFILFSLARSITSPLRDLTLLSEGLSQGKLDVIMDASRKDEFGMLASYFNSATERLSMMISNVQNLSLCLTGSAERLSKSASEIAHNTQEQSAQTSQASSAIEEMNSSFLEVARNSAGAAESSQEAAGLAVKGGEVVSETIKGMDRISQSVNESAQRIETLGNRSEQIGQIIQVIEDIAGQTNLLALNAAIEAARAGEQGRGFAVVADEVRKLAERTSEATNEIGDMIKGIQEDTAEAVLSMTKGTGEVQEGVGLANQAGEALQRIVTSVQNVTDMVQQIAVVSEEQSSTGEVISSNVESVASLTQLTADNAMHSSETAREMYTLIQELEHLISSFKLRDQVPGADKLETPEEQSMRTVTTDTAGIHSA